MRDIFIMIAGCLLFTLVGFAAGQDSKEVYLGECHSHFDSLQGAFDSMKSTNELNSKIAETWHKMYSKCMEIK